LILTKLHSFKVNLRGFLTNLTNLDETLMNLSRLTFQKLILVFKLLVTPSLTSLSFNFSLEPIIKFALILSLLFLAFL